MGIKILRQTISSTSTEPLPPPPTTQYGIIACDRAGSMYVGDSSNSPVEQMSVKKYSQTSNPNLLDNTNFFNPINQRNQTSYSNTDAAPKYSIDRWQVLGGTFDVQARTYTSNSTLGIYGNQFRQYIPLGDISIGDTITVRFCCKQYINMYLQRQCHNMEILLLTLHSYLRLRGAVLK